MSVPCPLNWDQRIKVFYRARGLVGFNNIYYEPAHWQLSCPTSSSPKVQGQLQKCRCRDLPIYVSRLTTSMVTCQVHGWNWSLWLKNLSSYNHPGTAKIQSVSTFKLSLGGGVSCQQNPYIRLEARPRWKKEDQQQYGRSKDSSPVIRNHIGRNARYIWCIAFEMIWKVLIKIQPSSLLFVILDVSRPKTASHPFRPIFFFWPFGFKATSAIANYPSRRHDGRWAVYGGGYFRGARRPMDSKTNLVQGKLAYR